MRFLKQRSDVGEQAGVTQEEFSRAVDTDLALSQMARAATKMEARSAVGEDILSGRLTDLADRVLLYARGQGQGTAAQPTPEERDQLRVLLASVDLVYERQIETARSRKLRRAPRQAEQAQALARKEEEKRRLLLREELRSGKLPE